MSSEAKRHETGLKPFLLMKLLKFEIFLVEFFFYSKVAQKCFLKSSPHVSSHSIEKAQKIEFFRSESRFFTLSSYTINSTNSTTEFA